MPDEIVNPNPLRNQRSQDGNLLFSAIIPTKYRPTSVETTVRTLLWQTFVPHEIIVIDQSSNTESRNRVYNQFAGAPTSVQQKTILSYIHDSAICGAAAARNRGMEFARGNIWLFLDDDVEVEQDCLEQLAEIYRRFPDAVGVSAIFTNYRTPKWWVRAWRKFFLLGPFYDERAPIYSRASRLRNAEPLQVRKFTGAAMSFRADAVCRIRFDEHVHGTGAEDADFCARITSHSALLIAPKARVFHRLAPEGRSKRHWVETGIERATYLYKRNWNFGIKNRLFFGWLLVGYSVGATLASIRRISWTPWRGLWAGIRDGTAEANHSRE